MVVWYPSNGDAVLCLRELTCGSPASTVYVPSEKGNLKDFNKFHIQKM